ATPSSVPLRLSPLLQAGWQLPITVEFQLGYYFFHSDTNDGALFLLLTPMMGHYSSHCHE
ncbi:unnamed protein product, partial [Staurois parvus]